MSALVGARMRRNGFAGSATAFASTDVTDAVRPLNSADFCVIMLRIGSSMLSAECPFQNG